MFQSIFSNLSPFFGAISVEVQALVRPCIATLNASYTSYLLYLPCVLHLALLFSFSRALSSLLAAAIADGAMTADSGKLLGAGNSVSLKCFNIDIGFHVSKFHCFNYSCKNFSCDKFSWIQPPTKIF